MRRASRKCAALFVAAIIVPGLAFAQSAEELQQQIDEQNSQIAALNKEIAEYQAQLDATSKKKQTLQNELAQLNISLKKITASITVTKKQISSTQLQIQQLASGIHTKEASISGYRASLGESLRSLNRTENVPFAESLLSSDSISEAWNDADAIALLQSAVQDDIRRLAGEKEDLTKTKTVAEQKREQLLKQQKTLVVQQGSLDATVKAQKELLAQTKSQESTYQSIIAQKKAQEAAFEQALSDLQSRLQYIVNPDEILKAGKGIIKWPLDVIRITQHFGDTAFAKAGGYNGKGHNGIDLAAQIGTPVKAALSGVVVGTGNTDSVRGCYSFGKWVLIQHNNGLDTMYAHFSQIAEGISAGQPVGTGQVIGYSGQTGYATGPHLHFGVYVSSATQIMKLGDATNKKSPCSSAMMPIAPLSAYLNPENYL
ncbi:MAG: peptidoglycan DD-metalloendopeptidase family protein [bacterium]|nr:peptidoglycan DD-metalloendopeptidase family protein [bacterium]